MSYTRLKSLFGRLSRRNSSASETSRPASPVPAHSPLHNEYNDLDVHSPGRTRSTTITITTPEAAPDRPDPTAATDTESFATAQTSQPKRPGIHRRHSSSVSGVPAKIPDSPPPAPPLPIPHRRPTSLALRASSLGPYPITGESAFAVQGESFHERRVASMSSVEREEERGGSRQTRGRERHHHHHHHHDEDERESSEYSSRGPPEVVVGSVPYPNRSTRALSFLTNFAKRAKPPFISSGGSSSSREIGRKGSGVFERAATESEPPPPITSTSHALIPFSTAGTFPAPPAPPLTALSTATSSQFTPAIDALPPQPIEVLLLALTTSPSVTDETTSQLHNPIVLARQLAKQLRNPTNPRGGVGVGMPGARGSALVSAGALGEAIRSLRKSGVGGGVVWDIVGAWLEGDATADIEKALLWSALTDDLESLTEKGDKPTGVGGGLGIFDPDEWAERDRTVRALTDGGKDILGLRRFIAVIGKWVEEGCTVVAASHATVTTTTSLPPPPIYVQAQKSIDASLRLLEAVLKHNAPRFGEKEVVQVVEVFCRAIERTIGPWGNSNGGAGRKESHRRQASSVASPVVTTPLGTVIATSPLATAAATSPLASPSAAAPPSQESSSAPPYMVTASRFVALVRALQKWTHVPPVVLQMMLDHLALVLAYVKTPLDVLRLGGRRKSGAGVGGVVGGEGRVDWVDAYSRTELEGEVSGAFKVLLAGPYAVAVGRMLLGLLVPSSSGEESITPNIRNALVSLGVSRAIRLSVREAAIPRMARMRFQREPAGWTMSGVPSMGSVSWDSRRGSSAGLDAGSTPLSNTNATTNVTPNTTVIGSDAAELELMELMFNKDPDTGGGGAWETDRIVGVLGAAFSIWVATLDESDVVANGNSGNEAETKEIRTAITGETKMPAESVLIEMLGIVDDLLQEAAEDEKAFGIEEGRVVGEVVAAAIQLFSIYGATRVLDLSSVQGADSPILCPVLHTLGSVIRKIGLSTPVNPPLIHTLFSKSVHLTDLSAVTIIRHYVSMSLVTPSTPAYLDNIRQLAQHFYRSDRPLARIELAQVIDKLYFGVRDLAEHRRGVVSLCLEIWGAEDRTLVEEPEFQVVVCALRVLGDAIVAGSVESDGRGKTEERLRFLVALVGRDADCPALKRHEEQSAPEVTSPPSEGQSRTRDSSPTPMMSLLSVLTPTVLTPRELPPESAGTLIPKTPAPVQSTPTCVDHVGDCKAMAAVVTLIEAFSALAFSPPHSLSTTERTARAPASFQCILVMRDLLALLSPVRGDTLDQDEEAAEERSRIIDGQSCCSFARLAVLQWLVRLRADRDHRLYMIKDLDKEVEPFASLINRTPNKPKQNDAAPITEPTRVRERERDRDRDRRNRGMTTTTSPTDAVRIGRNPSRGRASDSRSRSRQPPVTRAQPPPRYNIWAVPEVLPFEVSFGTRPSEGMTTYEQRIEPSEDGLIAQLWLPVSAYVRIMIDLITSETDWEILSYALCHLPLQMSNKHLFCGPRTRNAIVRLISQLCTVVHDDKLTKNIGPLPAGLKVTDVQGLAYHTLTTLMSYHRTFDKWLQDALLQTFLRGLNKNTTTVKPCLQALAVAAFELQPSMTKFLGEIVDKLSQIMSNPTIAGYILELLCIIGSLPSLYANFTDDNYRRVFHVPLQYITLHNRPDSHAGPAGKESYALTQHVLILAYYQIYIWFLALKLKDRPNHIPYITRHLLLANEHYDQVDEPTEVCFDWLARFTYANAEPKPRMSSLRESVLNPAGSTGEGVLGSKSWVFGNSIVTIKTLRHSGWLEMECRRPSGLSTFLCKLENIASLGLGEQVTGEVLEAAAEGMTQGPLSISESGETQSTPNENPPTQVLRDPSSTPSGIMSPSGVAAPKEMELDPSYLALLLSPYPDVRRASIRGRLVQNDDLLSRTLRSLDRVPVMDLHTVGILYVGPGQTNEREILSNRAGSPAYTQFLDNLGRLIRLKDQRDFYTGGLDSHYDGDGRYAYAWWDVIGQVLYHTATLMPNREGDEQFAFKKLHIGNDYVRIVWNDSGKPYRFDTLATQFQYVNIVVEPHSLGTVAAYTSNAHQDEFFKVSLQRAPGMPEFGMIGEFKIISAKCLPNVIRQTSMLADFFAQIYVHTRHDTVREEYITPWRQRLRQIRMFKSRLPALPVEEPVEGILGQESARDFSKSY